MTADPRGACPDPETLTALVDGELDPAGRDGVLLHLAACSDCRDAADAERRMKSAVHELPNDAPSADLMARLRATPFTADRYPDETGDVELAHDVTLPDGVTRLRSRRPAPAMLGAAASVAVFMVGAFAFIGASAQPSAPSTPAGTTAIVPAVDRLTQEHAVTTSQVGFGGPGFSTVSVSVPQSASPTVAP